MPNVETENITIGRQTFNLLLRSLSWRNENLMNHLNNNGKKDMALTPKQFFILYIVENGNVKTLSQMESALSISVSSLSSMVSKLVNDGYLKKEYPQKGEDGRKVFFYITDKGRQMLDSSYKIFMDNIDGYYNSLGEKQKKHFKLGIEHLLMMFEE